MLYARTLATTAGIEVSDVACRHGAGRGGRLEEATRHAVVLVRRGCFVRAADGVEALLDPTTAYCMNPSDEQRFDHPYDHGDDCTAIFLSDRALGALDTDGRLPAGALSVSPTADVEHRLLLSAARDGERDELLERATALVNGIVADRRGGASPRAHRAATVRARRALASRAGEALAADPALSLAGLAEGLGVSPHHLSRVFRAETGSTVSRHRMRLRTRAALERLAGGETDLARLAADLGFADQSHLSRVVRDETGHTPGLLRRALGGTVGERG